MQISSAFIIAASALLYSITEAAPMNQGQGHQEGQASNPHHAAPHTLGQANQQGHPLPLPPTSGSLEAGLARLRINRPQTIDTTGPQTTQQDWEALARSHRRGGKVNEFGSPIQQPHHGQARISSSQLPQPDNIPTARPLPGGRTRQGEEEIYDAAERHPNYHST